MPTLGKLFGALIFAALFAYASTIMVSTYPREVPPPWFYQINIVVGLVCGWQIAGTRAGRGAVAAVSFGITTVIMVAIWSLLIQGVIKMFTNTRGMQYDGPTAAVVGVFEEAMKYGKMLYSPQLIAVLFIGGILAAIATDWVGRKFS